MNIAEHSEHRNQLFEVIDAKVASIYHATRSRKNIEEVREYVLVLLFLCRNYLELNQEHFLLRREYAKKRFPNPTLSLIQTIKIETLLPERTWEEETITLKDIHAIRRYFTWLFSHILEIHSFLERIDYATEEKKRYLWIHGNKHIRPRKGGGGGRVSGGGVSMGSKLEPWSGIFRARHSYDCDRCPFHIERGEKYEKEVIRFGESVEIFRYHINCPDLPDDPERYKEENVSDDLIIQQAA